MGNLLRAGVALAAAVVLAGGVWYLARSGSSHPDYRVFRPEARTLHALGSLPGDEITIQIGLLLLIATPVARVLFTLIAFMVRRDRLYGYFALAVLAVLLYSLGTSWL